MGLRTQGPWRHLPAQTAAQAERDPLYPWRAAAIICANSVQAKLKLLETSTAEKLSATRDRGGPTRGYVLAHAAALAASMSRELDPSYEKAHHRLAMAEEACGDGERAEHAREILADIRMYRDHTAKIVAAGQLKVRADLSYDAYEPSERMWPARLISYQVGLISARSLWHWGNRDLPRVFEFLRAHTSGPLHLRCSLVELDNTYSLARQGIHVKDEDKNRYGSYEKGGQWLSIGLNTGDNTPRSTLVQLEQVWFVRCDTTGAAALDGPLAYEGGTDTWPSAPPRHKSTRRPAEPRRKVSMWDLSSSPRASRRSKHAAATLAPRRSMASRCPISATWPGRDWHVRPWQVQTCRQSKWRR